MTDPVRLLLCPILVIIGCDSPNEPAPLEPTGPATALLVGSGPLAGVPGFSFLPPVAVEVASTSDLDENLLDHLEVVICRLEGSECASEVERLAPTDHGSRQLRLEREEQPHYHANWHSKGLQAEVTYSITVEAAGTPLGTADVALESKPHRSTRRDVIRMKAGRTLPVRFHIDEGTVYVLGPAGGTLEPVRCAGRLTVPEDALHRDVGILMMPPVTIPDADGLIEGTACRIDPVQLSFQEPATLQLQYEPDALGDVPAEHVLVHRLADGGWIEVNPTSDASHLDRDAAIIAASIPGTGLFALLRQRQVATIEVAPATVELLAGQELALSWVLEDALGASLIERPGRRLAWSSSDPDVATVLDGTVMGVGVGSATITASVHGATASVSVSVVSPRQPLTIELSDVLTLTRTIGFAGGSVATVTPAGHDLALEFPRGAIGEGVSEARITVAPITSVAGLGAFGQFVAGVDLGPDGFRLTEPGTLVIEFDDRPPANLLGFAYHEDGQDVHLVPVQIEGNSARLTLHSFSGYGVLTGECATAPAPSSIGPRARQQIACILTPPAREGRNPNAEEMDALEAVLLEWWALGVVPRLNTAIAGPSDGEAIEAAVAEYLDWRAQAELLGLLADRIEEGRVLTVDALWARFGYLDGQCTAASEREQKRALLLEQRGVLVKLSFFTYVDGISGELNRACGGIATRVDHVELKPASLRLRAGEISETVQALPVNLLGEVNGTAWGSDFLEESYFEWRTDPDIASLEEVRLWDGSVAPFLRKVKGEHEGETNVVVDVSTYFGDATAYLPLTVSETLPTIQLLAGRRYDRPEGEGERDPEFAYARATYHNDLREDHERVTQQWHLPDLTTCLLEGGLQAMGGHTAHASTTSSTARWETDVGGGSDEIIIRIDAAANASTPVPDTISAARAFARADLDQRALVLEVLDPQPDLDYALEISYRVEGTRSNVQRVPWNLHFYYYNPPQYGSDPDCTPETQFGTSVFPQPGAEALEMSEETSFIIEGSRVIEAWGLGERAQFRLNLGGQIGTGAARIDENTVEPPASGRLTAEIRIRVLKRI